MKWTHVVVGAQLFLAMGGCGAGRDATEIGGTPAPTATPGGSPTATPTASPGNANAVVNNPNHSQPPCMQPGLLLCDDFETTAVGANPNSALWTVNTVNSSETLTVDTARAYSGSRALHIHTTNNGYEDAQIINRTIFPVANNSFYGRMFFYLDSAVPMIHTNFVRGAGTLTGQSTQASYAYGAQFGPFLANYYDANDPSDVIDDWQHAGTQVAGAWQNATYLPSRTWACLEWYFKGDTSEMHLWLDGNSVTSMDVVGQSSQSGSNIPWTAPPFSEVDMGWTVISNTEDFNHFDVYLDAVALGSQRIGCTP